MYPSKNVDGYNFWPDGNKQTFVNQRVTRRVPVFPLYPSTFCRVRQFPGAMRSHRTRGAAHWQAHPVQAGGACHRGPKTASTYIDGLKNQQPSSRQPGLVPGFVILFCPKGNALMFCVPVLP